VVGGSRTISGSRILAVASADSKIDGLFGGV